MLSWCSNLSATALDETMDEFSAELIAQLETALRDSTQQRVLLQQRETLREIINDIPARQWLFEQACQTDNCAQAKKARLLIIRIMQSSSQLSRGRSSPSEVYEEALARTWEWFSRNFYSYSPKSASFVTWFNNHLEWRMIDVQDEIDRERQNRKHPYVAENGETIDPLDIIPTPDLDRWEKTITNWLTLVQSDAALLKCRMQDTPHVNGQILLAQILQELRDSGEFCWETIAQIHNIEPSSLKRFCRNRCFPRFKQLCAQ
jgi:hypothetical protein